MKRWFVKILRRLNVLRFINITVRHSDNRAIHVPIVAGLGYEHLFNEEPWLDRVLGKVLAKTTDTMFVDVGVNIGQTLIKVKSIDAGRQYVGFEPNPACLYYLDELLKRNQFQSSVIYPVAVAGNTGFSELLFFHKSQTDSTASMVHGFRPQHLQQKKIAVMDGTIISALFEKSTIGILKIDVEGGEPEVLEAFAGVVVRDRPLIICEILPVYDRSNRFRLERQERLVNCIHSMKYRMFRIHADGSYESVDNPGIHSEVELSNYICIPKERVEIFISNLIHG